jgi:hypothetical protein
MNAADKSIAWPTRERVTEIVAVLDRAEHELDKLLVDTHGLLDEYAPLELSPDRPAPTAEDLAALAVLAENIKDTADGLDRYRISVNEMLNAAAYQYATASRST